METRVYKSGEVDDRQLAFAVIHAAYKGSWILVRQKGRNTWEIPGGHREADEDINATASRELYEETGVVDREIEPVCDYSVTKNGRTTFGRLFFCRVEEMGELPESEIEEVKLVRSIPENLTYPDIQPKLHGMVLEHLREKASLLLEKDKIKNINIINFMKNYPVNWIDTAGASVLVRGRSDEEWSYITGESEIELQRLIKGLDKEDKCFAVLEDWMLPHIIRGNKIRSRLTSIKLVYDRSAPTPAPRYDAVDLPASEASYIYGNSGYKEYISIDYIDERIRNGVGLGIYEGGRPIAWALTHDDGAIGFLNVLEGYRGKGYGTAIMAAMVKRLLELGEVPFLHIEEDNHKSMSLALKTGFRKDRRVHWIKLS